MKTDPKIKHTIDLKDKNIRRAAVNICYLFKNVEERLRMVGRNMEDIKRQNRLLVS